MACSGVTFTFTFTSPLYFQVPLVLLKRIILKTKWLWTTCEVLLTTKSRNTRSTNPVHTATYVLVFPHALAWERIRVSAVRERQLPAWSTAWQSVRDKGEKDGKFWHSSLSASTEVGGWLVSSAGYRSQGKRGQFGGRNKRDTHFAKILNKSSAILT